MTAHEITDLASAPAHAATLAHCGRLRSKIIRLTDALNESVAQLFTVADREYRAGLLSLNDLARLYEQARGLGPGFSTVWDANVSVTARSIRGHALRLPPPVETPYWSGPYPYDGSARPVRGTAVVYVLYDANLEPIYLGSTGNFSARMRQHRDNGKAVAWWLAYPCESREAAYLLEAGLLAARKPPLNVKAGR